MRDNKPVEQEVPTDRCPVYMKLNGRNLILSLIIEEVDLEEVWHLLCHIKKENLFWRAAQWSSGIPSLGLAGCGFDTRLGHT